MSRDLMLGLARILADNTARRERAVNATWSALTRRERRLVREAAVMGYVQGVRAGLAADKDIPDGYHITARVIGACLSMSDLYPVISHTAPRRADR